jgi:hypothetical protein
MIYDQKTVILYMILVPEISPALNAAGGFGDVLLPTSLYLPLFLGHFASSIA